MAQTSLHSSLTTHTQSSLNEEKHLQVLVLEIVTLKKQSVSQKNRKLDQLIRCISRSAYLRGKGNYSSNIYPMSPFISIRLYGGDEWRPANKLTEGNPIRKI